MICSKCNFENQAGAEFCLQCGEPLAQTIEQQLGSPSNEPSEFAPKISELPQNFETPDENDIIKLSDMDEIGVYNPQNKSKKVLKVMGIIGAVVLAFTLCLGIAYAISPRDVLQLFLSDQKYIQLTIGKNILGASESVDKKATVLNRKSSSTYDAGVNVKLTSEFMKEMEDEKLLSAGAAYLNSLRFKGTESVDGLVSKSDISVLDRSGELFDVSIVSDKYINYINSVRTLFEMDSQGKSVSNPAYVKVNAISEDWLTFSEEIFAPGDIQNIFKITKDMKSQKKQVLKGMTNVKGAFFDVCFKDGKAEVKSNKQLFIGAAIATGDEISFVITPEKVKAASKKAIETAKEDEDLFQGFKQMYDEILKKDPDLAVRINSSGIRMDKAGYELFLDKRLKDITEAMDKATWSEATARLYVDKNNQIIGVQVDLLSKGSDKKLGKICVVLPSQKGNKNFGISYSSDAGEARLEVVQKTETSGTIAMYGKFDEDDFIINSKGTYKNVKVEDGVFFGEINQNIDLMYVYESKQETDKIKLALKSKKDGETQKITASASYEEMDSFEFDVTVTKNKFKAFEVPSREKVIDLTALNEENAEKILAVYDSAVQFFFETLPTSHPDLVNFFETAYGEEEDGSLFEGLDEGLFVDAALTA